MEEEGPMNERRPMNDEPSAARDLIKYSFLHTFAEDGNLDQKELEFLEGIALRDGHVDEQERTVLATIFSRISPDTVPPEIWVEVERFKERFGIG
jgi:hypothetical protein